MKHVGLLFPFVLGFAALFSFTVNCYASEIVLQQNWGGNPYYGCTDAWLDAGNKHHNNGGDDNLHVEWYNGLSDDTVIKFDLTGQIPANQHITSATLSLYYNTAVDFSTNEAVSITAYRLAPGNSWYENTGVNLNGQGVNWDYHDQYQTSPWTNENGGWNDKVDDGDGTVKIKKTGGTPQDAIEPMNWANWNVTNTVSLWYGDTENDGFLLVATNHEGDTDLAYGEFDSKESERYNWYYRPILTIDYVPEPATLLLLGLGATLLRKRS